jgi:aerobic-type carbon monoxide dehydrogenase small subunit (CoxS/CutS family)
MAAKSLLEKNPHPARHEIERALAGNLCRCTGYVQILQAIERAAAGDVGKPISV